MSETRVDISLRSLTIEQINELLPMLSKLEQDNGLRREQWQATAYEEEDRTSFKTLFKVGDKFGDVLYESGLVASKDAARRAIDEGAITIDGWILVSNYDDTIRPFDAGATLQLRRGKRTTVSIQVEADK